MLEWKYLCSTPFQIRFLIAAHYLIDCENIIEIGGYKNPITRFLTHPFQQAVSIDPLMEPFVSERVLHVQEDYRLFDFKPFLKRPFGLVLLGMDLPFDFKLLHLVASAKIVIIEYPQTWAPSRRLFRLLKKNIALHTELHVALDLSKNDWGDLQGSYPVSPKRVLHVLKPAYIEKF